MWVEGAMIVFGMFVTMLVISMVFVAISAGMLFLVTVFVFLALIFVVRFLAMFVFVMFILAVIIVPIIEGDRIDTSGRDHPHAIETGSLDKAVNPTFKSSPFTKRSLALLTARASAGVG
tara:strand:+ start:338 stop:694 length:357 start_codon:yes stop_codon:yes gene_type:complete